MDTLQTHSAAALPPIAVHEVPAHPTDGADEWMTDALRRAIENVNAWHWQNEQTRWRQPDQG